MSEQGPDASGASIEGLKNQLDINCRQIDAVDFASIGTALGALGIGHVKDLLEQATAAVKQLSDDQEAVIASAKQAYEETEVGVMALIHTTDGVDVHDEAQGARAEAFIHESNANHLVGEVREMGGSSAAADPIHEMVAGLVQVVAAVTRYEAMRDGAAITVGQIIERRKKIYTHVNAYKRSL